MPAATSVFVGGGTPSLVEPGLLMAVLEAVPRAPGCEVTVECNPDTVTPPLMEVYAEGGVNRISLGVQSMVDHVLRSLGRTHDPANVHRAGRGGEGGRDPHVQPRRDLRRGGGVVRRLAANARCRPGPRPAPCQRLRPHRRTGHAAGRRPGAAAGRRRPGDEVPGRADALEAAGLSWYEISNWARPGHECRHNQLYWSMGEYQAVGCAGHSHRDGRRSWNVHTPERYIAAIAEGRSPEAAGERLDAGGAPAGGAAARGADPGGGARPPPCPSTSWTTSSPWTATAPS